MKKEYPKEELINKYRNRLKEIVDKKFLTTMIFAIAEFEKAFGSTWGHGKKECDKTLDEKMFYEKWKAVRTSVLNNGNKQKRGFENELDMHDVIWNRYTIVLRPVNKEKNNE